MASNAAPQPKKRPFENYDLVVEQAIDLTPRNKGLRFRIPEGKSIQFKAGQFIQMFVPTPEKVRRTSYSIASSPAHTDYFELCVTLVDGGVSSTFLHSLKEGDKIQGMGPLGKFTMPEPLDYDPVFVCTGSGIAPFRSMIHDLIHKGVKRDIYLVFGNRYEPDIIYREEWEDLAKKHPNFHPLFTLSRDQWSGPKGYVQTKIEEFVPMPQAKFYFICGLTNMINNVTEKLQSLGVPEKQIHFERYD